MLNNFKYLFLTSIHFLLLLIAVWTPRFAILGTIYFFLNYFKNNEYIGNGVVGYIIGLIIAGILMKFIENKINFIEVIEKKALKLKNFPFIEKYGENYEKPELENFEITKPEFISYNNRFQFEYIRIIILTILSCLFFYDIKISGIQILLRIITLITVNYIFKSINKEISKRHNNFEKINKYNRQLKIYYKIQKEKKLKEKITTANTVQN
ncbi:hypothetical protein LNI96_11620 [Tenacibaculum dicentrarchi]|nr:hypothetical protein [Tenacibaculum dicentrarchi]